MSVSSQTARVAVTITALPQTIPIFEFNLVTDLLVLDGGASNTSNDPALTLALNSDYTVTGGGYNSQNQLQAGNVIVAAGGTNSVQVGDVITILRSIPRTQSTTFASTGIQTPLMIEADDDRLTTLLQEIWDRLGLCLQIEPQETISTRLLRSLRANNILAFDSAGNIVYLSQTQFIGGVILNGITGYTGGGPTNIDGINTALYPNLPYTFGFIIGGALSWWQLQTSTATPGRGVIQPVSNSALRFIQVA